MSLLIIATEPELVASSTARTVCSRYGVVKPSTRQVHVREAAAADGELAAEIVAGRDARQHLDGAERIVGEHAAEILDVGASQDLLRGAPGSADRKRSALTVTVFRMSASAAG